MITEIETVRVRAIIEAWLERFSPRYIYLDKFESATAPGYRSGSETRHYSALRSASLTHPCRSRQLARSSSRRLVLAIDSLYLKQVEVTLAVLRKPSTELDPQMGPARISKASLGIDEIVY